MNYIASELNHKEFPLKANILQNALKKASVIEDETRDPRDLMSYLERIMSSIPKMKRHKMRRASHISSADWDIEPFDKEDENAAVLAKAAKQRLSRLIKEYTRHYVDGELFGASLISLRWEPYKDGLFKPFVDKIYRPFEIEPYQDYRQGIAILKEAKDNQFIRTEIPEFEVKDYIVNIPNYSEPGGILRTILYNAFMLNLARQEWSTFVQFLKGIIQAKIKLGASAGDEKAAVEAVKKAVENKATVTSEMVEFNWERINDLNSGNAFKVFQDALYEEIEIAITNTTMLASDRERNALTVLERGEEDLAREMRFDYEIIINDQLLKYDYYMNVNKSELPTVLPYEFTMRPKLRQDKTSNANIMLAAIGLGMQFTVREWNEKTGITLMGKPDEIVTTRMVNSLSVALNETED